MASRLLRQTPGIGLFAVFVFVLFAMPRLNVKLGSVPVYMIDLLILGLLWKSLSARAFPSHRTFSRTVMTLLLLALVSEFVGLLTFDTFAETIYISIRTCLAFSVFFIAGQFVRMPQDVSMVLRAAVLGLLTTASLMILSSLPMTRGLVADVVFSRSYLEPAAEQVGRHLGGSEAGIRGRTLVGVSIMGASFINVCWPLAALLLCWPWRIGMAWRSAALIACLIAPMGVLMSYSRGPIMGAVLIFLTVLIFGYRYVRRGVTLPVLVSATVVLAIGVSSQLFFFDRLTNRTEAVFENPLQDERESERLLAYVEPLAHVAENPRFLVLGEGITIRFSASRVASEQAGQATHATLAMAYYAYGLVAALLYGSLVLRALSETSSLARRRGTVACLLAQSLLLSVIALLPWLAFGHAAVSTPRGAMLFFLVMGLVSSLAHFQEIPRSVKPARRMYYAQRRALALR